MTPAELAHDLSALVATIDGVTAVYDARPTVLAAVAGALTPIVPADPVLVHVHDHDGTVSVTVAISVSGDEPAADTSRRVYARLDAWLAEHPEAPAIDRITVRIGRVS